MEAQHNQYCAWEESRQARGVRREMIMPERQKKNERTGHLNPPRTGSLLRYSSLDRTDAMDAKGNSQHWIQMPEVQRNKVGGIVWGDIPKKINK